MIKVGKKNIEKIYTYKDINYDKDGWADSSLYLPADYDLCILKDVNNKIYSGWHSGNSWDGLRVEKKSKILFWKRKEESQTMCLSNQ